MAGNIEIILAARHVVQVQVGHQDIFILEGRPGQYLAQRADDTTAAPRHNYIRVVAKGGRVVVGVIASAGELVAGQHEAAALQGDVLHGTEPGIASVGGRGTVNLNI